MKKRAVLGVLACAAVAAVASVVPVNNAIAVPVTRASDPVVLTGADLPKFLNGLRPTILGFRWSGSAWQQIPIQVDERAVVSIGKVYNNMTASYYGSTPGLVNAPLYTTGATFTGNDPNAKFDSDDELVFMARDAGVAAPGGSQPAGTVVGSGVKVRITDPLVVGSESFVYLFRKSALAKLKQGAGVSYVNYTFKLLSGSYKLTYKIMNSANLENSKVTTASYKRHFSDRWLSDEISVTAGGATGVDIFDRQKSQFAPGYCARSEDTFDTPIAGPSEGAFVINKNGPVRAIRSYVGANSGPSVQRTHIFYDRREDITTNLRVHAIPSVMDYFDYSPAASGMTYRNSLNAAGVTIDGNPDSVVAGQPTWEQVTGAQGTVTQVGTLSASFATTLTNYYLDDSTPPITQCTGDGYAYGQSGLYITSALPCTDPSQGCADSLTTTRTIYYDAPGGTAATAALYSAGVVYGLQSVGTSWTP